MKKKVLDLLSQREMSFSQLEEALGRNSIQPTIEKMEDDGLIFHHNETYDVTFLGKFLAVGRDDAYKTVAEQEDLFEFFRTRIPSAMPDELLQRMPFCDDYQIVGTPDLIDRQKEITDKALSIQPHVEKVLYVSAPIMFRPAMLHVLGVLKRKPTVRVIVPPAEHKNHSIFYTISEKITNFKVKTIEKSDHYMGLLYLNGNISLFGFRTTNNTPGWDAVIVTKNERCIAWVRENFEYMWEHLAREHPKEMLLE